MQHSPQTANLPALLPTPEPRVLATLSEQDLKLVFSYFASVTSPVYFRTVARAFAWTGGVLLGLLLTLQRVEVLVGAGPAPWLAWAGPVAAAALCALGALGYQLQCIRAARQLSSLAIEMGRRRLDAQAIGEELQRLGAVGSVAAQAVPA
ncbi:hypothetical protein [Acidovorax sp. sic0104]|uniref:hypothetical protein n=1 Tax=Acidovorax sp. sic0104 TaxID=2854784 RepID=UPI001C45BBB2|nr:hypothetical protein [Acidovorax sp. sic0104]MBV7542006.1 hypothetical protein [Acidovorax sp. sic0104]